MNPTAMRPTRAASSRQLEELLAENDRWILSRKLNGDRVLGGNVDGQARFWNRYGDTYTKRIPPRLAVFVECLPPGTVLDGELVDGKRWHLFDIVTDGPLTRRLDALAKVGILAELNDAPVELVAHFAEGKAGVVRDWLALGAEGFVAKRSDSLYRPGKTRLWVKMKFVTTLDCIVLARGKTKDNMALGLICNEPPASHKCEATCRAPLHEVGRCSALTGDGAAVQVGDVVTVTVLDVSREHRLIEPVRPILRPGDVQPAGCTWDQLQRCRRQR